MSDRSGFSYALLYGALSEGSQARCSLCGESEGGTGVSVARWMDKHICPEQSGGPTDG